MDYALIIRIESTLEIISHRYGEITFTPNKAKRHSRKTLQAGHIKIQDFPIEIVRRIARCK